jgi:hypothetical protein
MEQNKIYNQSLEEAREQLRVKYNVPSVAKYESEINQLTAEIYAQKFADWIEQTMKVWNPYDKQWEAFASMEIIGTTAQLHSKFVEENKGGGDE